MRKMNPFLRILRSLANRFLGPGGEIVDSSYRGWNVSIGKESTIGRGTVLRDDIIIGHNCRIGDLCVLEGSTIIGDYVDIESQCHITKHSRIGNHVFIAPFFLSTNDKRMAYLREGHGKNLKGVVIEDSVRIAGHVMTLPGVTIGEGAIVGSYSLVAEDVEPYTLVYGIPAKVQEDRRGLLKRRIDSEFE